jgi:flagellar motor switch/type III secretory pathway protein FliN
MMHPSSMPYDWRDPHYFTDDQRHQLTQLLGQVAARLAEIFVRFGRSAFEVQLQALTQHFAGDLVRRLEKRGHSPFSPGTAADDPASGEKGEGPLFSLPFGSEKEPPCGVVSIARQTACVWTTWLLGDAEAGREAGRVLSALEESLLSDLLAAVLDAFGALWRPAHPLRPAGPVAKDSPQPPFEPTEEVCRIVYGINKAQAGESSEVVFLLPCRRVAALVGKPVATPAKVPPQELSRALMEHLQDVPVTITAVLASTTMTFQEVLDLAPGDILLLDKPVAEPAELILDGRAAFRGRPARRNGHQAVVIGE